MTAIGQAPEVAEIPFGLGNKGVGPIKNPKPQGGVPNAGTARPRGGGLWRAVTAAVRGNRARPALRGLGCEARPPAAGSVLHVPGRLPGARPGRAATSLARPVKMRASNALRAATAHGAEADFQGSTWGITLAG